MFIFFHSHRGPIDEGINISQQEYDSQSRRNVERWVSVHIVPVCAPLSNFEGLYTIRQKSPIVLESHHSTLLQDKSITFTRIAKNDGQGPDWSRVTLEDGIHTIGMKEVRNLLMSESDTDVSPVQGLNGVLYLIDGAISPD